MARRRRTFLIQDPYDLDAQLFIGAMFRHFGMRPVCFYTDPKARFYGERMFPVLRSCGIERAYDVSLDDLAAFAQQVSEEYDVAAVVPYREDTVEVAAELCRHLDLGWNPADVVARFRDKHALKAYLRQHPLDVRVPRSRRVGSADELDADDLPERFVLKPNNGYGNRHVSIVHRDSLDAAKARIERSPGIPWVIEEYIDGDEYEIDGQVRRDGRIDVLAVLRYRRVRVNGYPTVYHSLMQINSHEPEFAVCEKYARTLIEASGLLGSPFHMEVKVDAHGPAMVDIGARLPSDGGGEMLSRMHPGRPDVYTVAAHDYVGDNDVARDPIDWAAYDAAREVFVFGISEHQGRMHSLRGCDDVERLPEFVCWPVKPQPNQLVWPTTDLRSAPYVASLRVPGTVADAERVVEHVHRTVAWDTTAGHPATARAWVADAAQRVPAKLGWLAARGRERLTSTLAG
jgi:hypothetical protein